MHHPTCDVYRELSVVNHCSSHSSLQFENMLLGNERNTYALVQEGNVTFPSPAWDEISPKAIAFIKRLMMKDPDACPTAAEALKDPWLQQDEVQPDGIDRKSSFISASSHHAKQLSKERIVKHKDRKLVEAFRGFMDRVKVRDSILLLERLCFAVYIHGS